MQRKTMHRTALGALAALVAAGATLPTVTAPAMAQAQHESVATQRDWFVFEAGEGNGRTCWIVAQPKDWMARRGNQRVEVNRGDIYLMVSARPADNVRNEVSMIAGYPFRSGSTVLLQIGDNRFELFTDGDKAWAEGAADDDRIVAAMKAGVDARLTGVSSRGTTTIDTFSLLGFTAALDDAQGRCR